MAMTFIYNYGSSGGNRHTQAEEMERSTVNLLHPEFLRRTFAMMRLANSQGVDLGIGGGQRPGSDQLDEDGNVKPGHAPPGNSNHQSFPWQSDEANAVAADMVGDWDWMEAHCGTFGLRTFRNVNDEPWHTQPAEIPASRSWREAPWTLRRLTFNEGFDPESGVFGRMPYRKKPQLDVGTARSHSVMYAQGVMKVRVSNFALWFGTVAKQRAEATTDSRRKKKLNGVSDRMFEVEKLCRSLTVDGHFGPKTAQTVVAMEEAFEGRRLRKHELNFDGKSTVGRETWFFLDRLADGIW